MDATCPSTGQTEPSSAASAVGVAERSCSSAERRARTTAVGIVAASQNGTSGADCSPSPEEQSVQPTIEISAWIA